MVSRANAQRSQRTDDQEPSKQTYDQRCPNVQELIDVESEFAREARLLRSGDFMDHPLRTLLFELFVAPPLRFLQRGITPTDGTKPEMSHNPSKASVESETLV